MSGPLSVWLQAPTNLHRYVHSLEPEYLSQLRERLRQVRKLGCDAIVLPISWRSVAPFSPADIQQPERWLGYQQICREVTGCGLRLVLDLNFAATGLENPRMTNALPDWLWGQALTNEAVDAESLKFQDQFGLDTNTAPSVWAIDAWEPYFAQFVQSTVEHLAEFSEHIVHLQFGAGPEGEFRFPLLGMYSDEQHHLPAFSPAALSSLTQAMLEQHGSQANWQAQWGFEGDTALGLRQLFNQVRAGTQPPSWLEFVSWYQHALFSYGRQLLELGAQALDRLPHASLGLRIPAALPTAAQGHNDALSMGLAGWPAESSLGHDYQRLLENLIAGPWRDRVTLTLTGLDDHYSGDCANFTSLLKDCAALNVPVMLENRQPTALTAHSQWDRLMQEVLGDSHLSGWSMRDIDALFAEEEVGLARLKQMGRLKHGQGQISQLSRKGFRVMGPLHLKVANQKQLLQEEDWQAFEHEIRVLRRAGISAVSTDLWWGLIEGRQPGEFDWSYYDRVVEVLSQHGMHWVPILSFHQAGGNVNDDFNQTIPLWLWGKLLELNPDVGSVRDLQYVSETGDGSMEYVSLWADPYVLPYYQNFMRAFADHYRDQATLIDEINVSLGPAGELRYPSYNAHDWGNYPNRGTLQCYSPLAQRDWASYLMKKFGSVTGLNYAMGTRFADLSELTLPDADTVFEQKDYLYSGWAREFLTWYHQSLVQHGRRILDCALGVFSDKAYQGIDIGLKVPGIHWQISDPDTPRSAEITAGLVKPHPGMNQTNQREYVQLFDALVPPAARNRVVLHFTCLEMVNKDYEGYSRAQDLVDWVADAADELGIRLMGENALAGELYNPKGWSQIHRALAREPGFGGITFLRMQNFFDGEELPLRELKKLVNRLQ